MIKRILFSILFLLPIFLFAQKTVVDTTSSEAKRLDILFADRYNLLTKDSTTFVSLAGNVKVQQGKTFFFADSAVLNRSLNMLEAFGNVHINDADSVHTYAQYLKYLGKEKKAFLKTKVRLTDGKGTLTTEELEYDVTVKIGTYLKGGKLVSKKSTLTSKEGYYYGDTKDVIFKKKVLMVDPDTKITTDTLQYNTSTELTTFTAPTVIYNIKDKRTIYTREGFYDTRNKKAELYKRSVIEDSSSTFTADEMAFDDSTGLGEFRGNAVYRTKDSTEGFDMIANNIKTNKKKNALVATQKPLLIIKQKADSIYITADTLYSAKLSDLKKLRKVPQVRDSLLPRPIPKKGEEDSTDKFFEAYYNIRIYSDSLQAGGDSLFYSLQDSVFRLYKSPVVWANNNQITGDTIYLYLKKKKPERLYVFENALAINRLDSADYYNQLKGRTINALFTDGQITSMRAKGNAENIYYAQDDYKKFVGVNKSSADVIDIFFDDNKPKKVIFLRNLDGTTYPMRQVNHNELRLRGFKWIIDKRPKSKFDILSN
ncbi:MAG: OstA-like protein [Sediminibacterium sp.]|jgi:lipopolysaccharide export system protein LptA